MSQPYPERLFYLDPYLTEFEAQVVERLEWEGRPAVVLDRTAFYPTSGGQPSDRGKLCAIPVVGIEVREADGAIVHLLEEQLPADHVTGQVDWERRFDHMQQHTGQHLLSAACEQLLDADTVSFHLGTEVSTIDLDAASLPGDALEPVERRVNRVIWEDRRITARFVPPEEVPDLPLRRPPQVEGAIRLVEVDGFDLNPCGGTHLARTGEIGLLKVTRLESRGSETRVEFLCGRRALEDYGVKNRILLDLASELTVGYWELPDAVARLQESEKRARHEARAAREQMLEEVAARLARSAEQVESLWVTRVVVEDYSPGELSGLAHQLMERPSAVVMLASRLEERVHLCFARGEEVALDMGSLLRAAVSELGGKGGGRPSFAQGSAPLADRERVEEVLAKVSVK